MLYYLQLDEEKIQAIKSVIREFYLAKFGEIPPSLTHAVALESIAQEIREKAALQEAERCKAPEENISYRAAQSCRPPEGNA